MCVCVYVSDIKWKQAVLIVLDTDLLVGQKLNIRTWLMPLFYDWTKSKTAGYGKMYSDRLTMSALPVRQE